MRAHLLCALGLALGCGPGSALACTLVLRTHPQGGELARFNLATPLFALSFTHSVLNTRVTDYYEVRGTQVKLVAERFEGDGYGLPAAAQPGERLEREGSASVLHTQRQVDPLLVRASRAQRTTLHAGRTQLLAELYEGAILIRPEGCTP